MTSIYEEAAQRARDEFMRLKSVSVDIISTEKLEEIREKTPDMKARAQITIEWEPLSYRKEGGKRGNVELEFFPISNALDDEEAENVRQAYYRGIPQNRRITIPKSDSQANQPWQRWARKANAAGLRVEIGDDGNFHSPDVGQVFRVEAGYDEFPTFDRNLGKSGRWTDPSKGEASRTFYMRYPVENVTESYVQPEDVPVRIVNDSSGDDDGERGAPATTAASSGGGISASALASALVEAGVVGLSATEFGTAAQQMKITAEAGGKAPVLFASEIQNEVVTGNLLTYALEKGAVVLDEDNIIRVAA